MDRLSSLMLRASFAWLLTGALVGAAMMADRFLPGAWRAWFAPTHGHMIFVGWLVQFALGVAYWLLPRRRSPSAPLGYRERPALAAAAALNAGLLLRVATEPWERSGHDSTGTALLLTASGLAQAGAFAVFVVQLWGRVGPRPARRTSTDVKREE